MTTSTQPKTRGTDATGPQGPMMSAGGSDPAGFAQRELTVTASLLCAFLLIAVGTVLSARVARVGPALLWCFGSLVTGFIVGFLFGFPRVLTEDKPGGAAQESSSAQSDGATRGLAHRLGVNTNLEQVSDWLTKIIVGVGLVELKNVPGYVRRIGEYIGAGLGDAPEALVFQQRFAAGIVVSFGGLGILAGYLLTRMFFSAAFRRADIGTIGIGEEQRRTIAATPLEHDGEKVQLPETARAASEKLMRVSQQNVVDSSEELAAWARVQFEAGQYENAIDGYRDAVARAPRDARLRQAYAIALKYGGRPLADTMLQLEEARRLVRSSPDHVLRRDIYASYTFNALYLDPPEGFTRARDAALEYVNEPANLPSGDVWLNLACAYGQQNVYEKPNADAPETEQLKHIRDEALKALKQVVSVEPRLIPRAQQLLDGRSPGDDDLVAFRKDREFREAIGLPSLT